jgi:hypothetical protein
MTGFIIIVVAMLLAPIALFIGGAIWSAVMGDLLMHRVDANADDANPATQ